uniref:Secreted protein n=1 Tax=Bursaphelenchus xylophilus TaxID=6326 RepID=A0A1I7S082_BURXY
MKKCFLRSIIINCALITTLLFQKTLKETFYISPSLSLQYKFQFNTTLDCVRLIITGLYVEKHVPKEQWNSSLRPFFCTFF